MYRWFGKAFPIESVAEGWPYRVLILLWHKTCWVLIMLNVSICIFLHGFYFFNLLYFILSFGFRLFLSIFSCLKWTMPIFCAISNKFPREQLKPFLHLTAFQCPIKCYFVIYFSYNTNAWDVANGKCFVKRHSEILTWLSGTLWRALPFNSSHLQ